MSVESVEPLAITARRCYVAADRPPVENALVTIAGGRVTGVHSDGSPPAGVKHVDLSDAVLTAGLVDSHTHFFYWALGNALTVDLAETRSLDEARAKISAERGKRAGVWLVGRGFDQNAWRLGRFPTKADLDDITGDTPTLVHSRDHHSIWLNSAGLKLVNADGWGADPPGGCVLRDEHGAPTGVVQERAMERLPQPLRELALSTAAEDVTVVDAALDAGFADARRAGIVGVHSMDDAPSLTHLLRRHRLQTLGLRVAHAIPLAELDAAVRMGWRSGIGDDWLRVCAVKIFSDGALGSQTALMFDAYPGRPGYVGVPVVAGEELRERVVFAARHGWACWIHAIGDRAVHETLAAMAAGRAVEASFLHHRVEHAQCVRPEDIAEMARLKVVASVQPCHVMGDIATADEHWPEARRNTYPFAALRDGGVLQCYGSDIPVESIDPRRSFFGAVARTDEQGAPEGGWFGEQRVTAADALEGFTRAAYASLGMPGGTLTPGAAADIAVWGADPLETPGAELLNIPIRGVVLGGRVMLG